MHKASFGLSALIFVILIFISCVGLVYSKHVSRQLFSRLQCLQTQQDGLHVEWSQLLLEQGTWGSALRVERVAREHLNMVVPAPNQVVVLNA